MLNRNRFLVLMWAVLTLVLCFGDHYCHVATGRLSYHWAPLVDGQSVWVWLIFAVAAAAFVWGTALVPMRDVPAKVTWPALFDTATVFVTGYALSGQMGATHPTALTVGLVVAWLVRVAARGFAPAYLVHGVVFAAIGVAGEGLFSMMGLFDYQLQQVVDCPWWLAGLYLHGSVALLEMNRSARALAARA